MGKFWDDLNNFLAGGTSTGDNNDPAVLFKQLAQATADSQPTPLIEGIQPESLDPLKIIGTSPYERPTSELDNIIRQGAQGFNTIDINPNTLDPDANNCLVDSGILSNIWGFEPTAAIGNDATSSAFKPWRTVLIQSSGNFLKLEGLPARRNVISETLTQESLQLRSTTDTTPFFSQTFQFQEKYARVSGRQYLIHFDNINSSPIVAKPGDSFNISFSKVYITLKFKGPRVRLTTGYNTSIQSAQDNRLMNSNLAMGPGYGLWEQANYHPTPFCISSFNISNVNGAEEISATPVVPSEVTLIQNISGQLDQGSIDQTQPGVGIGWISEITYNVRRGDVGGAQALLYLVKTTPGANDVASQTLDRFSANSSRAINGGGTSIDQWTRTFTTPIRFSLTSGEKIKLILNNVSPTASIIQFEIKGYTMGPLFGLGVQKNYILASTLMNQGTFPFTFRSVYTEHPFPNDEWLQNSP